MLNARFYLALCLFAACSARPPAAPLDVAGAAMERAAAETGRAPAARDVVPPPEIVSARSRLGGSCPVTAETARARDPVNGAPFDIEFFRYRPRAAGAQKNLPTVVIYPSGFGATPNEGSFARAFCEHGLQALIVKNFPGDKTVSDDWDSDRDLIERGQFTVRSLAKLSEGPAAAMGISIGGIFALSAALRDPQFQSTVLLVTGAPFADVLAVTNEGAHRRQRARRMRAEGLASVDAYREKVRAHLPNDPGRALRANARRPAALVLIAGKDTFMPSELQWRLWEDLGRPAVIEEPRSGHVGAILKSFFKHNEEVSAFLVQTLR